MTLGQKLRKRREELGMSIDTLEKESGVKRGTIYNYEYDKTDPRLFMLTCIADVLGVSLDWLAGRNGVEDKKANAIRAAAFKEFSEFLKEKSYKIRLVTDSNRTVVDVFEIDNFLKERNVTNETFDNDR